MKIAFKIVLLLVMVFAALSTIGGPYAQRKTSFVLFVAACAFMVAMFIMYPSL